MADDFQRMSPRQLDALARERGYRNFATWSAFERQRSQSLRRPQNYRSSMGPAALPPAPEENFLQRLMGPIYPPTLLGRINDRYRQATGQ